MDDMFSAILGMALVDGGGGGGEDPRVPGIIEDISDINTELDNLDASIASVETGTVATRDYAQRDLIVINGKLYAALGNITTGTQLQYGRNIFPTTVEKQITQSGVINTSAPDVVISPLHNKYYSCNAEYVTSLTITQPSAACFTIRFNSGTTPTVLNFPSNVVMPDWWLGTEANRTYEIDFMSISSKSTDKIFAVVTSWAT